MIETCLRRSALYVPCANQKALSKVPSIDVDVIILDLEDAVAQQDKANAREQLKTFLMQKHPCQGELIVRINALDTPWGYDDLTLLANLSIDGICIPKLETQQAVNEVLAIVGRTIPIWGNIETPLGVMQIEQIVSHDAVVAILMGVNDLAHAMRLPSNDDPTPFNYAFGHCIMAARAYDCDILDGVYNHFKDQSGFIAACERAKQWGFDGKTLIHPSQIEPTHQCFKPSQQEYQAALNIMKAYELEGDKGILVVDGRIVEALHIAQAKRTIAYYGH